MSITLENQHWCTGSLVHWFTGSPGAPVHCHGSLVHWFTWYTGPLVHWFTAWCTGSLVHWCTGSPGAPVHWFTGSLVRIHWCTGSLVHWCTGSLVHWCTGSLAGSLVHWFTWCTGSLVHWFTWCTGTLHGSLVHLVHWFTGAPVHWFVYASRLIIVHNFHNGQYTELINCASKILELSPCTAVQGDSSKINTMSCTLQFFIQHHKGPTPSPSKWLHTGAGPQSEEISGEHGQN